MGSIHVSAELPAAPEKVWQTFSQPDRFEQWLTIHTRWKGDVPAEWRQGSQVSEVVTMLGMANTITWTVEEYDAPKKLEISGTGMAGVKVRFTLSVEPAGAGGSTATIDAEFTGAMIVGALGKAVEKDARKNLTESLDKLKDLVA
ncbi:MULTISPECIES: SRPBCC family protein [Amycolatopsis]|uniref:SRPBCC family protein n=1 Tax=Amycolatopsis thermalba TaxID=944492 RepID=A0ABY4NZ80_9PSEU|nr:MULTISPECIES: SRPBCC family protein [Amycolatopsis]OXM66366.1 polyketide cyclase [Amycolatopsis sp. KNN50.9b]UQS25405.1 SRPBCC family protein [Amycolatopsis thermalba]